MTAHEQKANLAIHPFWNLEITEDNGKISIPAGKFYLQGQEYGLEAIDGLEFPPGARLWVEKTVTGADYFLDTTGHAEANSFGSGIGSPLVAWNEGGEIHHLRSIE